MALRLTIDGPRWRAHVAAVRSAVDDLTPVVKGNGYGFGRRWLAAHASQWADEIAVGTVHEALDHDRCGNETVLALTPAAHPLLLQPWIVPTVGRLEHVEALAAERPPSRIAIKLRSSMHRYGASSAELAVLVDAVRSIGASVHCYVLHLPLLDEHGTVEPRNVAEVEAWIEATDSRVPLSTSHLSIDSFRALRARHPRRRLSLRMGTALWHGDKSMHRLAADLIDVRAVEASDRAGYRSTLLTDRAWLLMIGAGSAHGVIPLADGRSPFHFDRRRLQLLEPPHMHTSMALLGMERPAPRVGDWVDVQRPLISVTPDELVWR